jgi:hypothetical protein
LARRSQGTAQLKRSVILHSAIAGTIPDSSLPASLLYIHYYYNSRWMDIISDQEKNSWLKERRGIAFEEFEGLLREGGYLDIIDNPVRGGQQYFIMSIHDYTWVVPFVVSDEERVVLKTAFRSRKYHKIC